MSDNQSHTIIPRSEDNFLMLMPHNPNKDQQSRLVFFVEWLDGNGLRWTNPCLADYRNFLLHEGKRRGEGGLAPATVSAHLATIRGRYAQLLRDNRVRDQLYSMISRNASPADRKAFVDEALARLQNAVHPSAAPVPMIEKQDIADEEYLRLTRSQANALMRAPGTDSLVGLRDTAIICLTLCTGIREAELCGLDVSDLRQRLGGELALLVREGKGGKQRLIPYGPLDWALVVVDWWAQATRIVEEAVFRGIRKGGKSPYPTRITTRSVNRILNKYIISIDGVPRQVKPHDLRRTYARRAYEMGMDVLRIQQNLGHSSTDTTLRYIGTLDADLRRPPEMFDPPFELRGFK
jgi:integrase